MVLLPALRQRLRGVAFSNRSQTLPRCRPCLRRHNASEPMDDQRQNVIREPYCILRQWLSVASHVAPASQPRCACLATVDAAGQPATRMTNVRQINAAGLTFYTTLGSRVAGKIDNNPHVSLQFHWPQLRRSVHVSGTVSDVSALRSQLQFARYPREVQLGMHGIWASEKRSLCSRIMDYLAGISVSAPAPEEPLPLPWNWGGFLLQPSLYEFWHDNCDASSRRCMRFQRCLTLPRAISSRQCESL
ncbi:pyridoxine/pyridoxamine 5'-phosphate oxidase isoform X2 [Drosophila grimshawi]|uniref:pyridoxine/pyridoxamine 5'-phosphate oxidase isoform X2 n=1 Tax=Drosophila grimshawi TaxID=7222 RepID=UPI000C8713AF|nr:pyridoxine/pyridoxamine 5'-phosphate oxidase isoform X2 [Drosophila grimshawi]